MEDLTTRLLQLPEPQCSPCREAAAEIEMLRQQWREMSSAMMELRRENLHLKQELADSKRWAMSERAAKWDAVARIGANDAALTDAEREVVEAAARIIDAYDEEMDGFSSGAAATLRSLLSRTGQNSRQTSDNASKCTDQERKTPERDHRND